MGRVFHLRFRTGIQSVRTARWNPTHHSPRARSVPELRERPAQGTARSQSRLPARRTAGRPREAFTHCSQGRSSGGEAGAFASTRFNQNRDRRYRKQRRLGAHSHFGKGARHRLQSSLLDPVCEELGDRYRVDEAVLESDLRGCALRRLPLPASPDAIACLSAANELYPQTRLPRKTRPKRSPAALPRRSTTGWTEGEPNPRGRASSVITANNPQKGEEPYVSSSTSSRSTIGVPGADPASIESR